ncbi:hypothetical protein YB2330_005673 [Saitoella coloradoensis]
MIGLAPMNVIGPAAVITPSSNSNSNSSSEQVQQPPPTTTTTTTIGSGWIRSVKDKLLRSSASGLGSGSGSGSGSGTEGGRGSDERRRSSVASNVSGVSSTRSEPAGADALAGGAIPVRIAVISHHDGDGGGEDSDAAPLAEVFVRKAYALRVGEVVPPVRPFVTEGRVYNVSLVKHQQESIHDIPEPGVHTYDAAIILYAPNPSGSGNTLPTTITATQLALGPAIPLILASCRFGDNVPKSADVILGSVWGIGMIAVMDEESARVVIVELLETTTAGGGGDKYGGRKKSSVSAASTGTSCGSVSGSSLRRQVVGAGRRTSSSIQLGQRPRMVSRTTEDSGIGSGSGQQSAESISLALRAMSLKVPAPPTYAPGETVDMEVMTHSPFRFPTLYGHESGGGGGIVVHSAPVTPVDEDGPGHGLGHGVMQRTFVDGEEVVSFTEFLGNDGGGGVAPGSSPRGTRYLGSWGQHQHQQNEHVPQSQYLPHQAAYPVRMHVQCGSQSEEGEDGLEAEWMRVRNAPGRASWGAATVESGWDDQESMMSNERDTTGTGTGTGTGRWEEKVIVQGQCYTFEQLVGRLLIDPYDPAFERTFLTFYRKFARPGELLKAILARFENCHGRDPFQCTLNKARCVTVLKTWVQTHPQDFVHAGTRQSLIMFFRRLGTDLNFAHHVAEVRRDLRGLTDVDPDLCWGLPDLDNADEGDEGTAMRPTTARRSKGESIGAKDQGEDILLEWETRVPTAEEMAALEGSLASFPGDMFMDDANAITNVTSHQDDVLTCGIEAGGSLICATADGDKLAVAVTSFLLTPDDVVAKELTRIEWDLFSKLGPRDMIRHVYKTAEEKASHPGAITKIITHLNRMSALVQSMILTKGKVKHRAKVLEKFMNVACILRSMNNYNSLMCILAGINSAAVMRLRLTHELVKDKPTYRLFMRAERLMSSEMSFRAYRRAFQLHGNSERIPYLGIYLQDFLSINEGNKTFISDNVIHWSKFQLLGRVVNQIMRCLETPYKLERDERTESWVRNTPVMNEDDLYERSLEVEPRREEKGTAGGRLAKWVAGSKYTGRADIGAYIG